MEHKVQTPQPSVQSFLPSVLVLGLRLAFFSEKSPAPAKLSPHHHSSAQPWPFSSGNLPVVPTALAEPHRLSEEARGMDPYPL